MQDSPLTWYIAWGAIPAILSIVLFWLTKSKASVSTQKPDDNKKPQGSGSIVSRLLDNPLGVMGINLTGAAALFFLVFVMMNPIKTGFFDKNPKSDWKLKIKFVDEKGNLIPSNKLKDIEAIPVPIECEALDKNTIMVTLKDLPEEDSELKVNYTLRVTFDGYETHAIPLDDSINQKLFCQLIRGKSNNNSIIVNPRLLTTVVEGNKYPTPDSTEKVVDKPVGN